MWQSGLGRIRHRPDCIICRAIWKIHEDKHAIQGKAGKPFLFISQHKRNNRLQRRFPFPYDDMGNNMGKEIAAVNYYLEYVYVCHRGRVRRTNQDNFVRGRLFLPEKHDNIPITSVKSESLNEPFLLAIFDGMGGAAKGETASWIAAETFHNWNLQRSEASLIDGCLESNRRIVQFAQQQRLRSCGTTAAMLLFESTGIIRCNIGDSRIYRIHENTMQLLSETDTFPATRNRKSYLLQHLGIPENEMVIQPHTERYGITDGDLYLICSDGLSDMVTDRSMLHIIRNADTEQAGEALLQSAMDAGGQDNITFFLIRVRTRQANPAECRQYIP